MGSQMEGNTVKDIILMSQRYIKVPEDRLAIIEKVWAIGGCKAIEILARQTNTGYLDMLIHQQPFDHDRRPAGVGKTTAVKAIISVYEKLFDQVDTKRD